ncbi:ArgR family transcriptional regulator [Staphylococcus aureus]|nr:ArgR family transcriptional regulator [Staphylococcus aureus]MBG1222524.1 ArgR family transcriptional regulator [Staphylococcus aureus]
MKKEKRLNLILTVIQQNQFNKKQQIVDYMARHFGVYYSLTTISRDLQELEIFSDEIIEFITLNNYVLIKTSPGFAQSISYYIDQLQMKEILGIIGGNDTLMILTSSNEIAEFVCYQLFP